MRTLTWMGLSVLLVLVSPLIAAEVGQENILPASPLPAHDPCVSFGPSTPSTGSGQAGSGQGDAKYLVVWQSGKADKADIYACRTDGEGKPLDKEAFVVSNAVECQERPRAAWGKDSWLVVWADLRTDKDYDVYAARVAADGKVLDADGILIAGGEHNQCQPDVAWNGENFLVVWRTFGAGKYAGFGSRVSAEGKVLDQQPIKVGEEKNYALSVGELRVGAVPSTGSGQAAGKWLAAWVIRTSSLNSPAGGGGRRGLRVATIASDGGVTNATVAENHEMDQLKPPVTLASNGKDACLLSWFNGGTGGRSGPASGMPYGALRVDMSGKLLGTTELGGKKAEIKQPAAAWDGKGYLVVFWDGHRAAPGLGRPKHVNRIVAHLVAEDGKYEKAVEVSSGEPNPGYAPAACGDGKGNCLVVYERHPDKPDDTILIGAKLLRR